ncbi:DUF5682 family protein [Yinghuangia soli]|uniref:DUF5682 family protein n=1 Tax=Yinghuangia soli TaxID=2908204 RepID=A0AA41U3S4_9ACTN|nr:DUF5682 family protein [Yinghuangia soli]MCF2530042.1 DUF5682 family protein [Yinghuangia soli]
MPAAGRARPVPHLLGVRHHGPGSARAVGAALDALAPDIVLVEGPPEADLLLSYAADPEMQPPVALLVHAVDDPAQAGFWPYAEFSPEWVAVRYALDRGVPVRFIDLPAACSFALDRARAALSVPRPGGGPDPAETPDDTGPAVRTDPIAMLARVAGHDDPERWWEDAVEHRADHRDPTTLFALLAEAMTALREGAGGGAAASPALDEAAAPPSVFPDLEAAREAHMRLAVGTAYRQGFRNVAVVCGAWHVPALAAVRPAAEDRAVLAPFAAFGRGGVLPRVKVETTWVPWTYRRLAHSSGYGAGVASPGWYHHLFAGHDAAGMLPHWFVRIADLFRAAGRPVSPAHVIEAVRHAEALAALRDRPLPGLDETLEAVRAVMCDGEDGPLALVHDDIVVGDRIGTVPGSVPAVPLQRDLARLQKTLKLHPEAATRELELDLRKPSHAEKSRLLTRLELLDVPWGVPSRARRGTGTFREAWSLTWQPELAIRVAEAGVWGTTVLSAATNRAAELALRAESLAEVTEVAECCLRADLPDALPTVMQVLEDRAALDSDVAGLAEALPALVRALRYGDVRGTDTAALAAVVDGLLLRICIGLVPACAGLDADGAREMLRHLDEVHDCTGLLASGEGSPDDLRAYWFAALLRLADRADLPGLLTGRAVRLLLDSGRLTAEDAGPRMSRALSRGTPYRDAAAWIEGFLSGGGLLLVHDDVLLGLVDAWVAQIPAEDFTDVLPLLRRTFSGFAAPERRTLGERLRSPARGAAAGRSGRGAAPFDLGRADAALPLVAFLLGGPAPGAAAEKPGGRP